MGPCDLVRRYASTCVACCTGFVLLACDRTPPQGRAIPAPAHSAPAPSASTAPQKVKPIPGQEATPEALLDLDRIDCDLPASPKAEQREPRSEPLCFTKDLLYGDCESATLAVERSSKWGWVARFEPRRGEGEGEWSSDYLMGRGAIDECGSVTYQGARYPGFSDQVRAFLGAPPATVQARLLDHHQRSGACDPAHGAIAFGESSPGIGPGMSYGLTMFGRHPIQMEPASDLERSGVCPFYPRIGHPIERQRPSCELGTYFAEDDLPALGKLVVLSDFAEGCTDKERSQVAGARFYLLGWGEVDRCGSVRYRKSLTFGVESVLALPGLRRSRHTLEMIDHRARQPGTQCPAHASTVELREEVEVFQWPSDSSKKPVSLHGPSARSFYSPRELTPGAGRSASGSPE